MRDDQIAGALATCIQAEVSIPEAPATLLARRLADVLTPVVRAIVTDAVLSATAERDEAEAAGSHE